MLSKTKESKLSVISYKDNVIDFIIKVDLLFKIKVILFFFSIYIIIMSMFSTQIGYINPAIITVWIGWWLLISFIFLPINAKNWCSVCPIPLGGQLFYRYAPLKWIKSNKFNKKFSIFGMLPILLFLLFSAISVPLSTIPVLTGIVLLLLIISSTLIDVYYDERTFCKNICPINSLLLTYNRGKRIQLNTIDFSICASDHIKTCMIGTESTFGCDWGYYPGNLKQNENNCVNCLECIKSCDYNNLKIRVNKNHMLPTKDEKFTFVDFIAPLFFLGIILTYSITKIGSIEPFHSIVLIDNFSDFIFSLMFESIFSLVLIPGMFLVLVISPIYILTSSQEVKLIIKRSSVNSIPLSLSIWIVFSIFLIIPNINLIFFWIADPLLLNWNILNFKSMILYSGQVKELLMIGSQLITMIGYYLTLYLSYKFVNSNNWNSKQKYIILISQFLFYSFIFGFMSVIYYG